MRFWPKALVAGWLVASIQRVYWRACESHTCASEHLAELNAETSSLKVANERLKDSLDRHRTKLKSTEKTKAKLKLKLEHYAEKAAVSLLILAESAFVTDVGQKNERLRKRLEAENIELAEQMNKVLMKNRQLAFQKQDLEQTLISNAAPEVLRRGPLGCSCSTHAYRLG